MSPAKTFALCAAALLLIPGGLAAAGQRSGAGGGGGRGGGRVGTGAVGRSYRGGTISSTYGPARIRRSPSGVRYQPARSRFAGSYFRRGFGGGGLLYVPLWTGTDDWGPISRFPGEPIRDVARVIEPPPAAEPSLIQPMPPTAVPQSASAQSGSLRIQGAPAGAQVYVDGFFVGTTEDLGRSSDGLSLGAGWHRLELRAAGHATLAANVTIEANQARDYRASLQPLKGATAF